MNKIPTLYKIYMLLIITIGTALIAILSRIELIHIDDVTFRQGTIEKAQCINYRSSYSLDLIVNYSGVSQEDFLSLPLGIDCDSISSDFIGADILITYHENANLGLTINGKVIKVTESELAGFNDKTVSINFILFIMLISVLCLYFKSRHAVKEAYNKQINKD